MEEKRPRVLIVEDDPDLAMAMVHECLQVGLEPKLCRGPSSTSDCPGMRGEACPRTQRVEATLIGMAGASLRAAAPACVGGRLLLCGNRPLTGATTDRVLGPDAKLSYPYSPPEAAQILFRLVKEQRKERGWAAVRGVS